MGSVKNKLRSWFFGLFGWNKIRITFTSEGPPRDAELIMNAAGVATSWRRFDNPPRDKPITASLLVNAGQGRQAAGIINGVMGCDVTDPQHLVGITGWKPRTVWSSKPQRKWTPDTFIVEAVSAMVGKSRSGIPVKSRKRKGKKSKLRKVLTW